MLTSLDTTRLIPRQQPGNSLNPATPNPTGPVFTIPEILDILEDRPEMREAIRQALVEFKANHQEMRDEE